MIRYSIIAICMFLSACSPINKEFGKSTLSNPAVYFEIPVSDMKRAEIFYETVFGFNFSHEIIHGNEMAMLPFNQDLPGITGALAKGQIYKPSREGVVIYISTFDIQATIERALNHGGKELFPRTKANEYGYVAEIEDSEGNRIGLFESK